MTQDEQKQERFLAALERKQGSVSNAMRATSTTKYYLDKWMEKKKFADKADAIKAMFSDCNKVQQKRAKKASKGYRPQPMAEMNISRIRR